MYMSDTDKNALTRELGRIGGTAVTLLAECTEDEANHPDT